MHKLNRPGAPACLNRFRARRHHWRDLNTHDKKEIRDQLAAMQGQRCGYCEVYLQIDGREGHIEHFEQQRRSPTKTFDWTNLFGSCDEEGSCGKHKDRVADTYAPADLIKPDVDDPDDYLHFLSDGRIVPRGDLNRADLRRAEETLRVFNLDHERGRLRRMRYREEQGYAQITDDLQKLAESDPDSLDEYWTFVKEELLAINGKPFETAIRHVLTIP